MSVDVYTLLRFLLLFPLMLTVILGDILYSENDPVRILNSNTIHNSTLFKTHAVLLEFYNSWCGHCIRFAPTWKEFAHSIDGWKPVIEVAVLDCSEESNVATCQQYNIESYPCIKFLPPHTAPGHVLADMPSHEQVNEIEDEVVDLIELHAVKFDNYNLESLLSPLKRLDEAWKTAPSGVQFTVVIFEESGSYLGRKVILDAIGYKEIYVRRILKESLTDISGLQFPSLNLLERDGSFKQLVGSASERSIYKQAICDLIGILLQNEGGAGDHPLDNSNNVVQHQHSSVVHMQDLESTVHYALRHEIATCKTIGGEKLVALKTFTRVLAKYFPGQAPIRKYLSAVSNFASKRNKSLTGSEWLDSINALETSQAWLPSNLTWTGCHGSRSKYRGYPCGVWTLFHTLTVSADKETNRYPKEVLYGMKAFIVYFLGCSECGENFKKEIQYLESKVNSTASAILYLWEVHNSVNKRLHGDITEDPVHPKVQFPTNDICPKCHVTEEPNSIGWNVGQVFKFLKRIYAEENIVKDSTVLTTTIKHFYNAKDPKRRKDFEKFSLEKAARIEKAMKDIKAKYESKSRESGRTLDYLVINETGNNQTPYLGLSGVDISLCVLFYCCCSVLIVVIYLKVISRKRKLRQSIA